MEYRNSFRATIDRGEVAVGARCMSFSAGLVEVYGGLGLDFVWLDFEHGGWSPQDTFSLEQLTRAGEIAGIDLVARVPLDEHLIRTVLDAGVRNVLIPRIDTAEEAYRAVNTSRFVHDGEPGQRGYASGRSSSYGTIEDYVDREDESVCVGVMIETKDAINDLEAILSVPELGFVFVGPADLSVQLGHPGELDHPDVREVIDEIERSARSAGVPLGGVGHDPARAGELLARGYQVIRIGGEFEATRAVLAERLGRLDELRH